MSAGGKRTLTKRVVDAALPGAADYFIWDKSTPNFGLRVYPSGRKVYVAFVRVGRRQQRIKIGAAGPFTVQTARERAKAIIRTAADGGDPRAERDEARRAITVAELCDAYREAARAGLVLTRFRRPKRAETVAGDEGRIARHVKPQIGTVVARNLTRAQIQRMADAIAAGKTAGTFKGKPRGKAVIRGGAGIAARVVEMLGGIYSWGEARGLVAGPAPIRGVATARGQPKERVLSDDELGRLGKAIRQAKMSASSRTRHAAAALELIALTGLRLSEACALRWSEIDEPGSCVRLQASKTGRSTRPISTAAFEVISSVPRKSDTWVFPRPARVDNQEPPDPAAARSRSTGGPSNPHSAAADGPAELKKLIAALFDQAGLSDARAHDLRRTFGSTASDEGYSDATIGELLGHARRGVTAKHYIRRPDPALLAAANRTAARIAAALAGRHAEVIRISEVDGSGIAGAAQPVARDSQGPESNRRG